MKPILFNTDMVRAILDNRKTVTRRVVNPKPLWRKPPIKQKNYPEYWANWDDEKIYKAPYRPGDILYVRETWATWSRTYGTIPRILYKADRYTDADKIKWRPSIHMPREAARLFLRVTDVRVERLQEITHGGIEKEGIVTMGTPGSPDRINPFFAFKSLWDSTIKPNHSALYEWNANPWVWVIEFERVSKEVAEYDP